MKNDCYKGIILQNIPEFKNNRKAKNVFKLNYKNSLKNYNRLSWLFPITVFAILLILKAFTITIPSFAIGVFVFSLFFAVFFSPIYVFIYVIRLNSAINRCQNGLKTSASSSNGEDEKLTFAILTKYNNKEKMDEFVVFENDILIFKNKTRKACFIVNNNRSVIVESI
jgi:hypothetical protein